MGQHQNPSLSPLPPSEKTRLRGRKPGLNFAFLGRWHFCPAPPRKHVITHGPGRKYRCLWGPGPRGRGHGGRNQRSSGAGGEKQRHRVTGRGEGTAQQLGEKARFPGPGCSEDNQRRLGERKKMPHSRLPRAAPFYLQVLRRRPLPVPLMDHPPPRPRRRARFLPGPLRSPAHFQAS